MFFYNKEEGFYRSPVDLNLLKNEHLYLPIEVDTEFQEKHFPFIKSQDSIRCTISVQMRSIVHEKGMFFYIQI
uniref:Uncharacterized protein n=1 Tax=Sporolithon durum TaxID=48970 RepID=A0A141SD43_9FLOR|nr:hypothetical protein Sdur_173 [Sporolithon durum]AMK96211.1 hypothetical protein Sdur_173 [Sporolithon durum]